MKHLTYIVYVLSTRMLKRRRVIQSSTLWYYDTEKHYTAKSPLRDQILKNSNVSVSMFRQLGVEKSSYYDSHSGLSARFYGCIFVIRKDL